MQHLNILELLKVLGLPGVVIVSWIYDATLGGAHVSSQTWILILALSITVTFLTQWQIRAKDRVTASSVLQDDHRTMAGYMEAQTHVLLAIEAQLTGQLPLKGLLIFIPVALGDLKWVFETTLRNTLCNVQAISMISEALMTRSLEMEAVSRASDWVSISPFFKSKTLMNDLRGVITNIVQEVYTKLKARHTDLTVSDLQFIWELVDAHLDSFGDSIMADIRKELSDIDESLHHLTIGGSGAPQNKEDSNS